MAPTRVLDGTTDIDEYAFADASVTSVTLPSSLRRIGDYAFESSRLTSLTLLDSFETIGSWAFSYASNLARVDLGGTTTVSDDAFLNDIALTEVNLRPDLDGSGKSARDAFGGCTNLPAWLFLHPPPRSRACRIPAWIRLSWGIGSAS